ncbi:hypothetical protein Goarm_013578 [Gossypium armourianum]|uniref:Leucine-rich repeat-containing N-terminal plant-type domain-containing protein n=1 Tax=Gossypium armourianum TaxID=34283 RepID=A0A7J9J4B1_9ROSI|nr:hypothetical protein [Gossypium armourianum]
MTQRLISFCLWLIFVLDLAFRVAGNAEETHFFDSQVVTVIKKVLHVPIVAIFYQKIYMLVDLLQPPMIHCFVFYETGDALNALKTNMADPNNVLQSWDPTLVNPCTWFHVTCNSENSVTRVDLGNANLTGQLVPQLGSLPNLQYLELYSNNISGMIPDELGNLTELVSLDLYLNKLTGDIPTTLGQLKKLRFLYELILHFHVPNFINFFCVPLLFRNICLVLLEGYMHWDIAS